MLRITDKRAISTISVVGLIALMLFLEAPQAQAVVPTITAFSPASGGVGTVVAISGTGFTGGVGVTFNGVAASSFAFLTDTQVTATVPFGGTTGPISVVTPAGTATSSTVFTVTFGGPTAVDCTTDPSALQPAINAAAAGQTLDIAGTCIGTFTVSKDLTLEGPGATLDARGGGTTLTVSSGTVKAVGLTITGGTGTDVCPPFGCGEGGGVFNRGALNLVDVSVSGNDMDGIANFGGSLTITGSTVSGNSGRDGGGIYNTNGPLTLVRSTVSGNSADGAGGGILNEDGTVVIINSTVSGNSTADPNGGGGGILNTIFEGSSAITVSNSTISGNSGAFGGGILNVGTATLLRTTLSGNTADEGGGIYNSVSGQQIPASSMLAASINAGNVGGDCSGPGTATSNGYNLVGADCGFSSIGDQIVGDTPSEIGIAPLANNGGGTQTMALSGTSPALDAIPVGAIATDETTPLCPASGTTDQRDVVRPQAAACDIGAFERQGAADSLKLDVYWGPEADRTLAYRNDGTLTSGDLDVSPTRGNPVAITGAGTIPSTVSGNATVSFNIVFSAATKRWSGTVVVSDQGAGFSATVPIHSWRFGVTRNGTKTKGVLWGFKARSVPQKCFKIVFEIDDLE